MIFAIQTTLVLPFLSLSPVSRLTQRGFLSLKGRKLALRVFKLIKTVDSDLESMDNFLPLGFRLCLFLLGLPPVTFCSTQSPLILIDSSIWLIIRSTSSLFSTGKTLVKRVSINLPAHVDLKACKSSLANDIEGEPLGPDFKLTLQLIEKGLIGFNLNASLKSLADFSI